MNVVLKSTYQIGPIFYAARKKKGFSVNYVALKAGCATQTILNVERNTNIPKFDTLFIIAQVLDIELKIGITEAVFELVPGKNLLTVE